MRLLSDRIFIKPIQKLQTSTSGLILPTEIIEPEYKVLGIGAQCKGIKVGNKIRLYPQVDKTPYLDGYIIRESMDVKVVL